jgi:transcription initiation factor TFIID subunit 3
LKKKHNKTDQDSKYAGTILGRGIEHGEVMVEGGKADSLDSWARTLRAASEKSPEELQKEREQADDDADSRPPSSGLSSLNEGDVEMLDLVGS